MEDYSLLEGDTKLFGRPKPTFQKTVLPPFSGSWFHIHRLKILDVTF